MLPHLGLRPTPSFLALLCSLLVLVAACGGSEGEATPSSVASPATVISSEYGRIWGRLPADFPLLAEGSAEIRLDVLASGAIFSRLSVDAAVRSTVDELRRLAWEVAEPVKRNGRFEINAARDKGTCTVTVIVEALGSRTSLVVYLGESCPAP
ncbi:MAG: hypothetical protein ACKODF_00320 [Candidatus Limnocylindrus sp.]